MKMKEKLVSVIIPTYNRADLVLRAVESVCKQSYSNLEIIVVDDNSKDDTQAVIHEMAKKDDRIIYLHNSNNMDGGGSRNVGIENANGDIVAFLDSDDVWYKNRISNQIELFQDSDVVATYCNYNMVEFETGKVIVNNSRAGKHQVNDIYFGNYLGTTSCLMARKDILLQIGMFDARLNSCQDWDLYIRLIQSGKIVWEKEILLSQYIHKKRLSTNKENILQGNSMLLKKMELYCDKASFSVWMTHKIMSRFYYRMGIIWVSCTDYDEAKTCLLNSVKLNPFNYYNLKLIYKLLAVKNKL